MSKKNTLLKSSVGKKLVMALSGLFLVSFLLVHMSGNLLLFKNDGGTAFNEYTKFMTTNPLIKVAEWILFGGFLAHIVYAAILSRKNNQARPVKYAYKKGQSGSSSWVSRNMGWTGSIFFVYLIVHLVMFWGFYKFGDGIEGVSIEQAYTQSWKIKEKIGPYTNPFNQQVSIEKGSYLDKDSYQLLKENNVTTVKALSMTEVVKTSFKQWYIVLFYVIAMFLLALHLRHGFQSAFRSLGLVHKKYTPAIQLVGTLIAVVVPTIFALMPVWYFFTN